MDNLAVHTGKITKKLCESFGFKIMLTSPYSPFFNPIELWFNTIKQKIKSLEVFTM